MRGLPAKSDLQDLARARVFHSALRQNAVTTSNFTSEDDLSALEDCFRQGWLHADNFDSKVVYVFASPLHQWYLEARLLENTLPATFVADNITDFALNVIRMFSRQALSAKRTIGPGCVQRPPEAQYQDEFYRCCHVYSNGALSTFPEFGTAKGRVDFYIPTRQWGVELLASDSDQIAQHACQFSPSGIYQTTLLLSDYLMLDFRNTRPRLTHPGMCIIVPWSLFAHSAFLLTQTFQSYSMLYLTMTSERCPFWITCWRLLKIFCYYHRRDRGKMQELDEAVQ